MNPALKNADEFIGFIEEVENVRAKLFSELYQLISRNAQAQIAQYLIDPEIKEWLSEQEKSYLASYCSLKGLPDSILN